MSQSDTTVRSSFRPTPTAPRATPPTGGQQFRSAMAAAAGSAMSMLDGTRGFVPGAGMIGNLATRVSGATSGTVGSSLGAATGTLGGTTGVTATGSSMVDNTANQALELLQIQQQIGDEQRRFTTFSNVMKARHDTAKNLLGNIR